MALTIGVWSNVQLLLIVGLFVLTSNASLTKFELNYKRTVSRIFFRLSLCFPSRNLKLVTNSFLTIIYHLCCVYVVMLASLLFVLFTFGLNNR